MDRTSYQPGYIDGGRWPSHAKRTSDPYAQAIGSFLVLIESPVNILAL